ncbi:hypothetical protein DL764_005025 [Monosporascus ibericus]|uniref:Uncharacterized protein n=1 Tax=Monosporascus ibericus TaxID=155417 RepID=A0A4Q4TAL4_9PEZI|nr:hypothetical protein DL764_005025 [Monosporascus ibericus]
MQFFILQIALLAVLAASRPLRGRANDKTSFNLMRPAANQTIPCSNVTGAALSSTPFLVPVTDGKCLAGSGFSFSFRQVEDYAVELAVRDTEGDTATYTSGPGAVTTSSTGPGAHDTTTAYVGPTEFELVKEASA